MHEIVLPPDVPPRVLFQCGPRGEDPLADSLEMEFQALLKPGQKSVLVRSGNVAQIERAIFDFINELTKIEFVIDSASNPVVMLSVSDEVTHYIKNHAWITSAEVSGDRVVIAGHEPAVSVCADRLRLSMTLLGVGFTESKATYPFSSGETLEGPTYPFVGILSAPEGLDRYILPSYLLYNNQETNLPPSIFDCLDREADPVSSKLVYIPGIGSVPGPVRKRLACVAGPANRIIYADGGTVRIFSSDQSDLKFVENLLTSCATRRNAGACTSWKFPAALAREKMQRLESDFNVVVVHTSGSEYLLLGRDLDTHRCAFEILNRCEDQNRLSDSIPSSVQRIDVTGLHISPRTVKRAAVATDSAALLVGNSIYFYGTNKSELMSLASGNEVWDACTIFSLPAAETITKSKSKLDSIEKKWRCMIILKGDTVKVFGQSMGRIGAVVDIADLCAVSDWSALGLGQHIATVTLQPKQRLSAISYALNVIIKKRGKEVVIAADDAERVTAARHLLGHNSSQNFPVRPLARFTKRLPVSQRPLCQESIGDAIGCFCVFSDECVDIVSVSRRRRDICAEILVAANPEDERDAVLAGWSYRDR